MNALLAANSPQGSIGDYIFFQIIYRYLTERINEFGLDVMGRLMSFAGGVALVLMTLWLLLQGYRIVTGRMQGSMAGFIYDATRSVVIVSTATTMALFGTPLHGFLTADLNELVTYWITGRSVGAASMIDENLATLQVAVTAIDALQVVDDDGLHGSKVRAMFMSGIGIAGPSMTAGAMLLLFQMGMAMFIGFGPLFILALLFDATKSLFQRWLMYGIGTLFAMAVLSFVVALALKVVGAVAIAFWVSKTTGGLIGTSMTEGLSNQAIQQGGIGLLMTALILSAPPMAAMFFQGTLGGFMHYSGFADGGRLGPSGQPPGSYGVAGMQGPSQPGGGAGAGAAERRTQLERAMASESSTSTSGGGGSSPRMEAFARTVEQWSARQGGSAPSLRASLSNPASSGAARPASHAGGAAPAAGSAPSPRMEAFANTVEQWTAAQRGGATPASGAVAPSRMEAVAKTTEQWTAAQSGRSAPSQPPTRGDKGDK